jgi:flavodoxin
MHTAIVYVSVHHGNTRRVAEAMARPLGASLLSVEEAMALDGQALDLVGFGSGIYFGRHHASLLGLVRNLKSMPARCFVFSTAGIASLASLWHRTLIRQIRRRESEVVGQFCSPGWDTVGPLWLFGGLHRCRPDEKDLSRAAQFARDLRAKFEATNTHPQ